MYKKPSFSFRRCLSPFGFDHMLSEHQLQAPSITVRMKRLGKWSTGFCEILFWEVCLTL